MTEARVVRIGGAEYRVRVERSGGTVSGVVVEGPAGTRRYDLGRASGGLLLLDGAPVEARLEDEGAGETRLHVDGESWSVEVLSPLAAALRERGGGGAGGRAAEVRVRSPMPGRVLAVEVDEGQVVTAGTPLFILEAMKMENEIRAPRAGVVRALRTRVGDAVETGQELCALGDPAGSGA